MPINTDATFDLHDTYVAIDDQHGAAAVTSTPSFWDDLVSGDHHDEGVAAVAAGAWLVGTFEQSETWPTWEVHPDGDEIVHLVSGELDLVLVLDEADGERTVRLRAGQTCIVPRGVWHRAVVRSPGETLHVTPGRGTEHRPVAT